MPFPLIFIFRTIMDEQFDERLRPLPPGIYCRAPMSKCMYLPVICKCSEGCIESDGLTQLQAGLGPMIRPMTAATTLVVSEAMWAAVI